MGGRKCEVGCTCRRHRGKAFTGMGYRHLHAMVEKAYGKAKNHACVDCGSQAGAWSRISGTDGTNILHYKPRCVKCHVKYDGILAKAWETRYLNPEPPKKTGKCRECKEGVLCKKHSENGVRVKERWQSKTPKQRSEAMGRMLANIKPCELGCQCGKHNPQGISQETRAKQWETRRQRYGPTGRS